MNLQKEFSSYLSRLNIESEPVTFYLNPWWRNPLFYLNATLYFSLTLYLFTGMPAFITFIWLFLAVIFCAVAHLFSGFYSYRYNLWKDRRITIGHHCNGEKKYNEKSGYSNNTIYDLKSHSGYSTKDICRKIEGALRASERATRRINKDILFLKTRKLKEPNKLDLLETYEQDPKVREEIDKVLARCQQHLRNAGRS